MRKRRPMFLVVYTLSFIGLVCLLAATVLDFLFLSGGHPL